MSKFIYVVDDDDDFRDEMLSNIKDLEIEARGYPDANTFLSDLEVKPGRCLLIDERMPGLTGSQVIEHLHEWLPLFPVVLVTGFADVPLAVKVMRTGAYDFIEKPYRREDLSRIVNNALHHSELVWREYKEDAENWTSIQKLTTREREILDLVLAGHSSRTVATKLDISPRTVDNHRIHIMTKLRAKSLGDLGRAVSRAVTLFGPKGRLRKRDAASVTL